MKINFFFFAILYLPIFTVLADEPLKVWNYADIAGIKLSYSKNNAAVLRLSPDVKTPDGQSVLEVALKESGQDAVPWDIQLRFIYEGGIKAGHSYEINFLCKGSVPGTLRMVAAKAESPWSVLPGSDSGAEISQEWQPVKLRFTVQKDWTEPLALPRFMLAKYGAPAILYFGPLSLREVPKLLSLSLNREWILFTGVTAPDSFSSMPDMLTGRNGAVKAKSVELKDNSLDFASFSGGFKEKDCAVLYNQFNSAESGRMRAGFAADWWLELYMNGDRVYSNIPAGNNAHTFTPDDHVVEFPVKAGCNVLAAKVLSGSGGWRFVCGVPARPPDERGIFAVRPGPDWKPVDMDKLIVKSGTALDFSSLNGARCPAGEFGRVIVNSSGRLAFEKTPERPVRFLSFNYFIYNWRLAMHTWTKKDIESFADSVANQGYNLLRIQSLDRFLLGYKVHDRPLRSFNEVGIPQQALDIQFDAGNCDRFDYLVACLKKNGVYVNIDLMFFYTGYTMAYPTMVPGEKGFRVQLFFNPEYRKHWEAAVGYLLNHRNSYTGVCLKDEPAIANLEPFNEQDILIYDKPMMKEFTPCFREYLKGKYQTDESLRKNWGDTKISFESVPDIDEDMLRKGDARSMDAGRFLIKTMTDMTEWYYGILRKNGYQGLVTQWDMIMRTLEIPVRAQMPVIAQHAYFAHPSLNIIPSKNLVKKSSTWNYVLGDPKFDVMTRQDSSINSSFFRASAAARFLDRPFIITEYSHSAFNRYRHERGLYFGSYAALQGWDSLAANSNTAAVKTTTCDPFACFENAVDPISRASEVVAALAWFRGDVKEAPHSVQLNLSGKTMFPKHFLAAIGDDYAKLAMLTKIGIVYPEVKPLSPVGRIKPDIELPMTEFSPLSVSQWYASASSQDGNIFPLLLQTLKNRRIISDSNGTDYSKRLFQSETGEITLNGKDETMTVVSPRLEGVILKKDRPVKLVNMEIESCSRPASVVVASLDSGKTIADSKRLLLVFSTNALNSGMTFENSSMLLLVEVGSLPVLMETARLSLKLKSSQNGGAVIYALNMDGTRAEQIPCELKYGMLAFSLDTARLKYGTPYFEIVYQ